MRTSQPVSYRVPLSLPFVKLPKFALPSLAMSPTHFIIALSVFYALVLNFPVLRKIAELAAEGHNLFIASAALLLFGCFLLVFSLLTIKYLYKPVLIIITMTSAMAMYATLSYNVMFDSAMIENIFETNSAEAHSYLSLSSIGYLVLFGLLPSLLIAKINLKPAKSWLHGLLARSLLILTALALIALVAAFFYKDYASVGRNNKYLTKMIIPAHVVNSVKYIKQKYFTTPLSYNVLGADAALIPGQSKKPKLVVLVVGETARAQNMAYNGYGRNTNPYTQDLGMISFQNVSSCGTATAHSLPCMFSNLGKDSYQRDRADAQDNVLDIIAKTGTNIVWIENDGGDKEVAKRLTSQTISPSKDNSLCNGNTCYDMALVELLKQQLVSDGANKLIALHTIGSHGPTYWQRYPDDMERFKPACRQSDIENCTDEEIINVYDNTLAYTDYVLASTIALLKEKNQEYDVALMYISDHGESLGENGLYLHGTPYSFAPDEQTKVPWFLWLDEGFSQSYGIDQVCLKTKAAQGQFSHDNLFHSLLGLYGVKTQVKKPELDIINSCKAA
ncbi:phosphoethanolamine--lipid A transferase [Shewanella sp. SR44-3]|uniref:phosphoethanolamine transferase n=1 Tax=Shewanella sp. SR44-3 TaxID=2760936 RepID=UPI002873B76B|nr:phosphoethanolamine--lipid A transferase [Shewanella sp. SR44-3]